MPTVDDPGAWLVLVLTLLLIAGSPLFETVPWIAAGYDQKRAAELAIVLLSLAVLAWRGRTMIPLPRPATIGLVLVGIAGGVSSAMSASPRHATLEYSLLAGLFLLTLLLASCFRQRPRAALMVTWLALAIGTVLLAVEFLAGCAGALIQGRPLSPPEIVPGFSNIRFLNQVQTWTVPLLALAALIQPRPSRLELGLGYAALAATWLMLLATGGRGSVLGLLAAGTLGALAFRGTIWPFAKFQLIGFLGGVLGYLVIFEVAPSLRGIEETLVPELGRTTDAGRLSLWRMAFDLAVEHPVLGVGPHHFAWFENPHALAHPHNAPLQIAAEWGIPATLVVGIVAAWGLIAVTKVLQGSADQSAISSARIALWISLVAGLTHSLFSGILIMPLSQLLMVLVCAAHLGLHAWSHQTGDQRLPERNFPVRAAAGLVALALATSAAPDLSARLAGEDPAPTGMKVVGPRLWQLGGIPHSTPVDGGETMD